MGRLIDLSSLAKLADVDYSKLKYRLNLGLSAEEAIALIKNEILESKNVHSC